MVGRVLDPQGKPVPGATVMAVAPASSSRRRDDRCRTSDTDCDRARRRRRIRPVPTRCAAHVVVAKRRSLRHRPGTRLSASAGPSSTPTPISPRPRSRFSPNRSSSGRLFDVQGRPGQGVVVSVSSIERELVHDQASGYRPSVRGSRLRLDSRRTSLPAWPTPATTDADGRFTIHGVGRELTAGLSVIDPRFALEHIESRPTTLRGAKLVTAALQPAKIFTGRVTRRHRQARSACPAAIHRQSRLERRAVSG